jgi:nitrogen fixation-related uncharacterized protein
MDLSTYLIGTTIVTFLVGAVFALIWSIASGQWRNLDAQALLVFDDDDEVRTWDEARDARAHTEVAS